MPDNRLGQIIYVSNSTHFSDDKDLQELLRISRRNNTARGITGMLLYYDGLFLQILEGEQDTITRVYEKIKTDPRHRACRIVTTKPVKEREFGKWAMAYQKPEGALALGFSDFMNNHLSYEPARMQSEAYNLMLKFRDRALKSGVAA